MCPSACVQTLAVCVVWAAAAAGAVPVRQVGGGAATALVIAKTRPEIARTGRYPHEERFLRDVYARLMRYDLAARDFRGVESGVRYGPHDALRVTLRGIRTSEAGAPGLSAPPGLGAEILMLQRAALCNLKDPCHVRYEAQWVEVGAAPPGNSLGAALAGVTRFTRYEVTLALGDRSRTYSALVVFRDAGDGATLSPEILDPLIPDINTVAAERAPLAVAPWNKYIKTRRYAAVVERIRQGEMPPPALLHLPIGFIAGDDVTADDEEIVLESMKETCDPSMSLSISLGASEIRPTNSGTPNTTTITVTTSPPTPGVTVNLSFEGERDSGGHIDAHHVGTRPGGTASPASGSTNNSGVFLATYTAPVIGERVTVRAQSASTSATATLKIQVPGLEELGAGTYYVLTGSLPEHPSNHWGTAVVNGCLVKIASDYHTQYASAESLRYNDQSLVMGGKFELNKDWQNGGSHAEHRLGTNCDIRMSDVPPENRQTLENIFTSRGSPNFLREPNYNHWHVRIEGGPCNDPPGTNNASFVSQSVPLSMVAGQVYGVTVTMQNNGTSTWTAAAGHKLGSQNPQDNPRWATNRVLVPSSIAPGQNASFSFNVTAPSSPGSYNFQWRMLQEAVQWFGDYTPNQVITVGSSGPVMQPDSAVSGCSGWWWWNPVYKLDAGSCLTYCQQNGANACEWFVNGDCYVEFGSGCYVQGGFSGWYAAVLGGANGWALAGAACPAQQPLPAQPNAARWWLVATGSAGRTPVPAR